MADIFISYARADREKIERLAAALEGEGYSVWWDRHIAGGEEFSKDIERELNAARAVLVAWSADANDSRWVKDEAGIAANAGKLVAISIDGSEPPIGFKQFHAIDYTRPTDAAFADIKRSIVHKLEGEAGATAPAATRKTSAPGLIAGLPQGVVITFIVAAAIVSIVALGIANRSDKAGPPPARSGAETPEAQAYQSIAVLAFTDLSPDRDQEYFSDGIAEELLNVLARETDLRVAARTSSFAFKGKDETIAEIGEALSVDAVLEGSLRKSGDNVRITAQLIDARSGFHLWSQTFDRELSDVFAVQDEIANAIVGSLPNAKTTATALAVDQTNSAAYDLFLQGRHQLARRTPASITAAKALFEQVIEIDPDYAPAWADLALSTVLLRAGPGTYGDLTLAEVETIAGPTIERALDINENLAEAYVARGLLTSHQGDFPGAIDAYRKAIDLNPSVPNARHLLYLTLIAEGEFAEAFDVIDRAVELDPLSSIVLENHSSALISRGRFDEAFEAATRINTLFPEWPHAKTSLARAHAAKGEFAESAILFEEAVKAFKSGNLDNEAAFSLLVIKIFDHPFLEDTATDPAAFLEIARGQEEEARAMAMKHFEENPNDQFAFWRAVWTLWATGEADEALSLADAESRKNGGDDRNWAMSPLGCYPGLYVAGLRQRAGERRNARTLIAACREILDNMHSQGFVPPHFERDMAAELLVLEGKYDEALAELRRLTDSGLFISWWLKFEPLYEPVRSDPRFQKIVADLDAFAEAERARYEALVAAQK